MRAWIIGSNIEHRADIGPRGFGRVRLTLAIDPGDGDGRIMFQGVAEGDGSKSELVDGAIRSALADTSLLTVSEDQTKVLVSRFLDVFVEGFPMDPK